MVKIGLIDQFGQPMPPAAGRSRASWGRRHEGGLPYQAAELHSTEIGQWNAWLASPDIEINQFRDRIVARVRDLVRNDGWASGAVTRLVDNVVGPDFRLMAKPDHRALARWSPAFDAVWADEFGREVEALWRSYAYDVNRWNDSTRRLTFAQQTRLAFRHELIDGESLAIAHWAPERMGYGRAGYATMLQIVDPDRLSNPAMVFDMKYMRGGVEIDDYGAAAAYHIRRAHQTDWFDAANAVTWQRIPRETAHGRRLVIHNFTPDRADQHRAAGGIFLPVVERLKMLAQYDRTELQAAVVNAIFAAFIESPYDEDDVQNALSDGDGAELSAYQAQREGFHKERGLRLNDVRIPTLFPGEKLSTVSAARPSSNFPNFEHAVLRNVASAMGISAEQVSQDWSRTNYSSARAALLEAWKSIGRRRADHAIGFSTPFYACWLEEAIERDALPLPIGAPDFVEARTAYAACRWAGAARGWIDPVKERQGAVLSMDAGLSTLEQECFEQGLDWEEMLAQRAIEVQRFKDLGLPRPSWVGEEADLAAQKPERPQPQ